MNPRVLGRGLKQDLLIFRIAGDLMPVEGFLGKGRMRGTTTQPGSVPDFLVDAV